MNDKLKLEFFLGYDALEKIFEKIDKIKEKYPDAEISIKVGEI